MIPILELPSKRYPRLFWRFVITRPVIPRAYKAPATIPRDKPSLLWTTRFKSKSLSSSNGEASGRVLTRG